jgi:hypothetical protein
VLPASTRLKLLLGFQYLLDGRDEKFGNGRLARNVFETAIRRLSNRIAEIAPLTAELLTVLEPGDIAFGDAPDAALGVLDDASRRLLAACPGCRRIVRFKPEFLGQRVKCKHCEHGFLVEWGDLTPPAAGGKQDL